MTRTHWAGGILIAVGILLLLDSIGLIDFWNIVATWWPAILIIVGMRYVLRNPRNLTSGLFIIALGCLFLADALFPDFNFWVAAIPVALIVIGIGIILRPSRNVVGATRVFPPFSHPPSVSPDELVNLRVLFWSSEQTITSHSFRGGTVSVVFGSAELDLRRAQMATGEAAIDVEVVFGSVEIYVPSSWRVVVQGSPIFGNIENKTGADIPSPSSVLNVRATVVFGNMEIV